MADKKNKSLVDLTDQAKTGFLDKVKERYIEKYADDVLKLLEDQKRLKRALDRVDGFVKRIEEGDFTAIEAYKKARRRLEQDPDEEI